jgi:xanthine dehydrogenase YagS FAD-binding subunit
MLPAFSYVKPRSLHEAVKLLSPAGSGLLAGGTDLLGCLRDQVTDLKTVVSITGLEELRGITSPANGGVRIGALATIAEIASHPVLRERYAALSQAAAGVASPQLRNQGTLGGNLCQKPRCWYYRGEFLCLRKGGDRCYAAAGENQFHCIFGGGPCFIVHPSDTAPALAAFGAVVMITGPRGARTVPAEKFHVLPGVDVRRDTVLEPGEVVTEVVLPLPPKAMRSSYRKVRARNSWDFALAGAAIALGIENNFASNTRIFLSGAAPVPWRATAAEEVLNGKKLTPDIIAKAADAAVKGAQPLDQNGYKVDLIRGIMQEELTKFAGI